MMLRRLLIANRGEIACRVIATARRLGLHTIAVYSDADAGARHVRLADEAWRLGPAPARDSYLSSERILAVAAAAHADAIHPGYGFLAESAAFASACAAAGVIFVGPPAAAIAAMGSKSAAKEAMRRAGVPVLPGYHGAEQSLERLQQEARRLGLPVIIKPCGGGGGKGMHIVGREQDLAAALAGARRVAESAFADPALLIERYLPAPRHVEVQVLCDTHGRSLHLHSRDCSVQRRHQKLIEEAPAPGIAAGVRERLHRAALAVAAAVGYESTGTVEFLLADGEFWFMEMNTRLQVEHGVTEQILGLDLVEWQLRIAAGEPLPFDQDALVPRGHAIEARVCAEDPAQDFAPCAGRLRVLRWPAAAPDLRIDSGFDRGDEVPLHYDSLLGKLIGTGADRPAAIGALLRGLEALRIAGVATNAGWLADALALPAFAGGTPTTRFLADYGAALAGGTPPAAEDLAVAALVFIDDEDDAGDAGESGEPTDAADAIGGDGHGGDGAPRRSPWKRRDGFRINLPPLQTLSLCAGGRSHSIEALREAHGWRLRMDDRQVLCTIKRAGDRLQVQANGVQYGIDWHRSGDRLWLWRGARCLEFERVDPRRPAARSGAHEGELVALLPGTIVALAVAVGERVAAGATLVVLEAMKMEHAVRAPRAGIVKRLNFAPGERVAEGAVLAELEEEAAADGAAVPE